MKIKEKLYLDRNGLLEHGPITIVAFGDSVTHGYLASDDPNYETVYWNRLKQKLNTLRAYIPVNVINAGVGGATAKDSLSRLDRQVLKHDPDLVIVCFGLNDINHPLEDYLSALRIIWERCKESGAEVIFMTPNMLNTYVSDETPPQFRSYAAKTAVFQAEGGRMDQYMTQAVALAKSMDVAVCDCYSQWKELSKAEDTTRLLANRINHPVAEMHELFADALLHTILADGASSKEKNTDSGMFCE